MHETWRWSNLGLAFLVELAGLGIFALWGWRTGGSTPTSLLLAIGLPLIAAVLWALFAAPTANHGGPVFTAVAKIAFFGLGGLALWSLGHVQLAKTRGARVIGVASGRHEMFLRGLGVDEFIDHTTTAIEEAARDVDHVFDTVGGPHGHRLLGVLKRGGTLSPVFVGECHRERAAARGITFPSGQVHSDGAQIAELAQLLDVGRVRVGVDSIFPLADAQKAHERAEQGHIQGKIVLRVAGD